MHRRADIEAERQVELLARASRSIAHDLRNVFAVINACAVDLYDEMYGRRAGSLVLEVLNAAERGLSATTDLMKSGRAELADDRPTDLTEQIHELEPILRRLSGPEVSIHLRCGAPVHARIDRTSLTQILMNLVTNAGDAAGPGGNITIECGTATRAGKPGDPLVPVAVVSVTDDGCGMTADVLAKVFDDGFSTKIGAHGGLGLAVVHKVVERCRGWIDVDSRIGGGTTFRVEFPLAEAATSGRALVVVADDDARELLVEALTDRGLRVTAAADPLEACDLIVGSPVAEIAILDRSSASDRGLWHMARLPQVRRTVAVGTSGHRVPRTRADASAVVDTCTEPTLLSPIVPPPLAPIEGLILGRNPTT